MRRFWVERQPGQVEINITGNEARHIAAVLRLQPGDRIIGFNGSETDVEIELLSVSSQLVTGWVVAESTNGAEPRLQITLVQGLAKGEKMDLIIQKAVELGVSRIIPVHTQNAVVVLDADKAVRRTERWNRVSLEACKQCGRSRPPLVEMAQDINKVIDRQETPAIFFYEQRKEASLRRILDEHRESMRERGVTIYIGPEGGFTPQEASRAEKAGIILAGLGPRTLRTETAALAAISILMWELGEI